MKVEMSIYTYINAREQRKKRQNDIRDLRDSSFPSAGFVYWIISGTRDKF